MSVYCLGNWVIINTDYLNSIFLGILTAFPSPFEILIVHQKTVSWETFICHFIQSISDNKSFEENTMTQDNPDKFDSMPFIALIHHISKNRLKYAMKNPDSIDMVHEGRYLMAIHRMKNLSQADLSNIFGQSKGTIAKALRKLEDGGYVERIIDEDNRRKYILNTTEKGDELAVLLIRDMEQWERLVAIDELDCDAREKLKKIARRSEEIIEE